MEVKGVMLSRSRNCQATELMGHHKRGRILLAGLRTRLCSCTEHLKLSAALSVPLQ